MGTDVWTYNSTYRGIEIQEFTSSTTGITTYTAYTDTWVMSASRPAVESKIDEFLGPEEEPPVDRNDAAAPVLPALISMEMT